MLPIGISFRFKYHAWQPQTRTLGRDGELLDIDLALGSSAISGVRPSLGPTAGGAGLGHRAGVSAVFGSRRP
jgi:hypothetical protein